MNREKQDSAYDMLGSASSMFSTIASCE